MTTAATNADSKDLRNQLTLVVKTKDTNTAGCANFNGTQLFTGTLAAGLFGDPATGGQAGDRTLAGAASEVLCFRATLPLCDRQRLPGRRDHGHLHLQPPSRPRTTRKGGPMTALSRTLSVLWLSLALAVLAVVGLSHVAPALGYRLVVIAGPSMSPAIPMGAVVIERTALGDRRRRCRDRREAQRRLDHPPGRPDRRGPRRDLPRDPW